MYPVGFSTQGLTKLWVAWKDGHKKSLRSFDTSGRYEVKDPKAYGIRGLKKTFQKDCNPAGVNRAIISIPPAARRWRSTSMASGWPPNSHEKA